MKKTILPVSLLCLSLIVNMLFMFAGCNTTTHDTPSAPSVGEETVLSDNEETTLGIWEETTPDEENIPPASPSVGLAYCINDDATTCYISGLGSCTDSDIVIPSSIDGFIVTSIGSFAFESCSNLTSVTIPDSVKSIKVSAFEGCSNLTSVTIPDSVKSIKDSAFEGCSNLTSITIPDGVTNIGYHAFFGCTALIQVEDGVSYIGRWIINCDTSVTTVNLRENIVGIGDHAFYACENLTSITIPDSVTCIGTHAFYRCYSLASITIPDSVTSISYAMFSNCRKLTNITFEGTVEEWNAMTFGDNWNSQVLATEVICSNGIVPLT